MEKIEIKTTNLLPSVSAVYGDFFCKHNFSPYELFMIKIASLTTEQPSYYENVAHLTIKIYMLSIMG